MTAFTLGSGQNGFNLVGTSSTAFRCRSVFQPGVNDIQPQIRAALFGASAPAAQPAPQIVPMVLGKGVYKIPAGSTQQADILTVP